MPADNTLNQAPSRHHSNGNAPYPCSQRDVPPGGRGFINYGFCRTSLDSTAGVSDPRCPANCKHKAGSSIVAGFNERFDARGALAAAEWSRSMHAMRSMPSNPERGGASAAESIQPSVSALRSPADPVHPAGATDRSGGKGAALPRGTFPIHGVRACGNGNQEAGKAGCVGCGDCKQKGVK